MLDEDGQLFGRHDCRGACRLCNALWHLCKKLGRTQPQLVFAETYGQRCRQIGTRATSVNFSNGVTSRRKNNLGRRSSQLPSMLHAASSAFALLLFASDGEQYSCVARLFVTSDCCAVAVSKEAVIRPRRGATVSSRTAPRVRHRRDRAGNHGATLAHSAHDRRRSFHAAAPHARPTPMNAGKGFGQDNIDPKQVARVQVPLSGTLHVGVHVQPLRDAQRHLGF